MITWTIFFSVIAILLFLDLYVFNKKPHRITLKESLILSGFYILIALLFGAFAGSFMGWHHANNYYTGYLIELSLSLDNLFVISLIFKFLKVPKEKQHHILFWGIIGVIVLRGIMIGAGIALVSRFEWIIYIFGVFLIFAGVKMFFAREDEPTFSESPITKLFKNHLDPKSPYYILWVILFIDVMDLVFAIDSVPAVFAITTNSYIVFTSNIFAIMGLRTMFFALDAVMDKFIYLQHALALVLIFIGFKVFVYMPSWLALCVTFILLGSGVLLSIRKANGQTSKTV